MKVYVVMVWNHEDSYVDSIWSTRESADATAAEVPYAVVEECDIDSGGPPTDPKP